MRRASVTTGSTGRGRVHPLPLHVQLLGLNQLLPGSGGSVRKDRLVWTGRIQPTVRSITYTVRITMHLGRRPDIIVLDPPLERRDGEALPHVFPGDKLCVYSGDQWDPSKPLSTTVLPWMAEWLYFYELWLPTGTWFGGGHEPAIKRPPSEPAADKGQGVKR